MTVDDFLRWEERQTTRYEFDGFAPVAMTGGTLRHGLIQANLIAALRSRLRGGPCRALGSHTKVAVAESIRYPDALVICSASPQDVLVVTDPVVVFEISSPSTAAVDHVEKNHEYRDTPSIQRYVLLEQDRPGANVYARAGDDWVGHLVGADGVLSMPEIGIAVPMAEIYEEITFPEPEADA